MVKKRRRPYRHRVRAHTRLGKPVKSFLRGKGEPRQPRKYRDVDGWVRKKVVVRKPPVVKKPPKPRKPRKPRKVVVEKPPEVIPKVPLTPEEEKRKKVLLDELEVHKTNLRREMLASGTVRTFDAKTRHYKEYLRHAKLHNDTAAELNRLTGEEYVPASTVPLRKMQKLWRKK